MYNGAMSTMDISSKPKGCVATTVAILGDKWTPLIIRTLAEGPNRFCQLQEETGGINPRTLSARLSKLEEEDIIKKSEAHDSNSPRPAYALTQKGVDLLPVINAMATWGDRYNCNPK